MNYSAYAQRSYQNLLSLQTKSGVFRASKPGINTGYDKAWFRDCIYEAMGLEAMADFENVNRVYRALFYILHKHHDKIVWACHNRPTEKWQYIHARYHPDTLEEFWEGWGNMQNDMIGLFLFKVGQLTYKNILVLENKDIEMIKLLVDYLNSIHYWEDYDNGMWEEDEEIHSSSIGNCIAGLKSIDHLIEVPEDLINKGYKSLYDLLPRESITKECDLAQLSLIWPCNILSEFQKRIVLENIENLLLRENGVIRYQNDKYYMKNQKEASWTFGFSWLAKIYRHDPDKYEKYMSMAINTLIDGEIPELYLSDGTANENCPLGWSEAMFIIACKS